ncbi:hypothetical protein GDO86_008873 [Hymenochirus boettgeri]|uniref:Uncharacterized protein n=1 Tax=Hymenochirus boettgeri TaxID=247094 RepID=A0A8T2J3H4_9PIPI|nr:hypothetical protein GDO86_008873 [Hymenochirus boettgeri]
MTLHEFSLKKNPKRSTYSSKGHIHTQIICVKYLQNKKGLIPLITQNASRYVTKDKIERTIGNVYLQTVQGNRTTARNGRDQAIIIVKCYF